MCAPDAPDTSKADATGAKIASLSEDQFNWVRQKYDEAEPQRAAAEGRAVRVSDQQFTQAEKAGALADESAADYRRIYRPQEEAAARDAAEYNTEARRNMEAGKAVAGVTQAFAGVRGTQQRNMASMGINVNDGAYASTNAQLDATEALGSAHAANAARQNVETVGRAMRNDVISTGRGVVGAQGTQAALGLNAGSASVGSAMAPIAMQQGAVGQVGQAANSAVSGLGGAANIYQRSAGMAADAQQAGNSGTGALAGAAMTAAAIF